jgi:hypothetical protein
VAELCTVRAYAWRSPTPSCHAIAGTDVPVPRAQHAAGQIRRARKQRDRGTGRITDSRARGPASGGDSFEVTAAGECISPSHWRTEDEPARPSSPRLSRTACSFRSPRPIQPMDHARAACVVGSTARCRPENSGDVRTHFDWPRPGG